MGDSVVMKHLVRAETVFFLLVWLLLLYGHRSIAFIDPCVVAYPSR